MCRNFINQTDRDVERIGIVCCVKEKELLLVINTLKEKA